MAFTAKLTQLWKSPDLRRDLLFVMAMLLLVRVAAHLPIPGVNVAGLRDYFQGNQILGLLSLFSGGGLENFSVVMLGVGPYITASIILQLLTMVIPSLEALSKEGEMGQRKINQYTRLLTVPLALLQAYGFIQLLRQQAQRGIIGEMGLFQLVTALVVATAGTIFLMWIGELISERKLGNGISLLIFAGIITQLPQVVQQAASVFDTTQLFNYLALAAVAVITIAGVVVITEAQRNIPVAYARLQRTGQAFGGVSTHLPLRVNQAGVIPIIFAISVILFPPMVAQFFTQAQSAWLASAAQWVIRVFQDQLVYGISYFVLVVAFTYFYTAVVFHPQQVAENLQKQGGFIPGIRPGNATADYLGQVSVRVTLAGSLFLGVIAVLPLIMQPLTGLQSLAIGGTSLLIVVSVVIETVKQINAQLVMRDYEAL